MSVSKSSQTSFSKAEKSVAAESVRPPVLARSQAAGDDISSTPQAFSVVKCKDVRHSRTVDSVSMAVPREIDLFKSLQFKHKPLSLEGDEIRLVELLAPKIGNPAELQYLQPIECRVVHVKLSDCPKYEALSYEWGQPSHTHRILIDSQPFLVRPNLWAALKHLQDPIRQTVLWIDALCINQDDARERNHQVAQMGDIYLEAERVLVWLGEASPQDARCLGAFVEFPYKSSSVAEVGQALAQMRMICDLPYWRRLWIIQEVVLGVDIVVYYGNTGISWSYIEKAIETFTDSSITDGEFGESYRYDFKLPQYSLPLEIIHNSELVKILTVKKRKAVTGKEASASILDLLSRYKSASCMDSRDRVFGLLNIADDCCMEAISVDYSKSSFEVAGNVMEHHLLKHRTSSKEGMVESYMVHHILTAVAPMTQIPDSVQETGGRSHLPPIAGFIRGAIHGISIPLKDVKVSWKLGPGRALIRKGITFAPDPPPLWRLDAQLNHYSRLHQRFHGQNSPKYNPRPAPRLLNTASATSYAQHTSPDPDPEVPTNKVKSSTANSPNAEHPETDPFESSTWIRGTFDLLTRKTRAQATALIFRDAMEASGWSLAARATADCCLAFEESGMICYVPHGTQIGDQICQFPGTNVAAVIRTLPSLSLAQASSPPEERYQVVGRAVALLHHYTGPEEPFVSQAERQEREYAELRDAWTVEYEQPTREVELHLDLQTLQLLTHVID